MTDLRKAAEMALKNWLANDEGVVRFGMELKPEWVSTVSHGFLSGYEEALRQALEQPEQRGHCTCGEPEALGVVHFRTRPCFHYTESLAQPEQDYERGFIDGMQKQMHSTVEKAVNAMTKREWVDLTDEQLIKVLKSANLPSVFSYRMACKAAIAKFKEIQTPTKQNQPDEFCTATTEELMKELGCSDEKAKEIHDKVEALRQALAMEKFSKVNQEIEEALKQPKWVGLEDEDVATVKNEFNRGALWAEQVLKEKNT